jgi:hypothetical protein
MEKPPLAQASADDDVPAAPLTEMHSSTQKSQQWIAHWRKRPLPSVSIFFAFLREKKASFYPALGIHSFPCFSVDSVSSF